MEDTNLSRQKKSRPPRRWLRYGLRTLIALTVLVAMAAAWLAAQVGARKGEEQTIARLKKAHGDQSVNVLYANPFARRAGPGDMEMLFQGGPQWLTSWLGVDLFRTVTSLQCYAPGNSFSYGADANGHLLIERTYQSGLNDDDMPDVGRLKNLRFLYLEAAPVGDQGISHLADLAQLETLNLSNTQVTDEALRTLAALPSLKTLDVSRTHVSDEAIEVLASFPALAEINLQMTRVSQEGAKALHARRPDLQVKR